jgi:hypothetical protein
MPTNNLIIKSLGSIELASGSGTPDHISPKGSLYTDTSTGTPWVNSTGNSTGWDPLLKPGFGEIYLNANAISTTFSVSNTWVSTSKLVWSNSSFLNGFTQSGTSSSMQVLSGKEGKYIVTLNGSIGNPASNQTYELGVSVNGATPSNNMYQAATVLVLTPADYRNINVSGYLNLSVGDTLSAFVRCTTGTVTVNLRHASLTAIKIY